MTRTNRRHKEILEHIEALKGSRKDHIDLLYKIMNADERAIYRVDLVVIAVVHRSTSLIDGFARMVEDRNVLCANALLRLQLDNINVYTRAGW